MSVNLCRALHLASSLRRNVACFWASQWHCEQGNMAFVWRNQ